MTTFRFPLSDRAICWWTSLGGCDVGVRNDCLPWPEVRDCLTASLATVVVRTLPWRAEVLGHDTLPLAGAAQAWVGHDHNRANTCQAPTGSTSTWCSACHKVTSCFFTIGGISAVKCVMWSSRVRSRSSTQVCHLHWQNGWGRRMVSR